MNLNAIGEQYRVPVKRDACNDPIIRGTNGHLYVDSRAIMVCFTDDGRKKPFPTARFKSARLKLVEPWVKRITQDGQYEFIAEIQPEGIRTALFQVLKVRRFKVTKGVSAITPGLEAIRSKQGTSGAKNEPEQGSLPLDTTPERNRGK